MATNTFISEELKQKIIEAQKAALGLDKLENQEESTLSEYKGKTIPSSIDEPNVVDKKIRTWQEENIPEVLMKARDFVGEKLYGDELVKAIGSELAPIFRGFGSIVSSLTGNALPEKSITEQQVEYREDTPEAFKAPTTKLGQAAQTLFGGLVSYGTWAASNVIKSYDYLAEAQRSNELKDLRKIGVTIPKAIPGVGGAELTLPDFVKASGYMRGAGLVEDLVYKQAAKLTAKSSLLYPVISKIKNPILKALGKLAVFTGSQAAYDFPVGLLEEPREGMTRVSNATLEALLGLGSAALFKTAGKTLEFSKKGLTSFTDGQKIGKLILDNYSDVKQAEGLIADNLISKSNNIATKAGIMDSYLGKYVFGEQELQPLKVWEYIKDNEFEYNAKNFKKVKADIVPQVFKTKKFNVTPEEATKLNNLRKAIGLDKRSVRSDVELQYMAQELSTNPQKLIDDIRTGVIKDKQVLALSNVVKRNTTQMTKLADKLEKAVDPLAKQDIDNQIDVLLAQTQIALKKQIKSGTELGRAVRAYKLLASDTFSPDFWLRRAQRELGGKPLTSEIVNTVTRILNDNKLTNFEKTDNLASFVGKLSQPGWVDKGIALWKAGLLTSPTTHTANILSTATMGTLENLTQLISTPIDKLASMVTGKRTVTAPNLRVQLVDGLQKGWSDMKRIMKYGVDATDLKKWDIYREINFDNKILDGYTKSVFRSMGAEDRVFFQMNMMRSLRDQAMARALNAGDAGSKVYQGADAGKTFKGKDLVDYLYKNPDETMTAQAIADAEYSTFNNNNFFSDWLSTKRVGKVDKTLEGLETTAKGTTTKKLIKGLRETKQQLGRVGVELLMPFKRTPTNVALRIFDYSPIGSVGRAIGAALDGNQREFTKSLARGINGAGLMTLGYYLASLGLASGTMPDDPDEREYNKTIGKSSNSVLINGAWKNLDRISPFGNLISLGADWYKYRDDSLGERLTKTGFSGLKTLKDQSFLRGVSGFLQALENPEWYGTNYMELLSASLIPSFIGRLANIIDPDMKEVDGVADALINKLPFLKSSLPNKVDPLGQTMKYEGGLWSLISPFYSKTNKETPHLQEIKRLMDLGYSPMPKTAERTIQNIPLEITEGLTPEELNRVELDPTGKKANLRLDSERLSEWRETVGKSKWAMIKEFIDSDIYKFLNDEQKSNLIKQIQTKAFGEAKEEFFKIMTEEQRLKNIRTKDQLVNELKNLEENESLEDFTTNFKNAKEQLPYAETYIQNLNTPRAMEIFQDDIDKAIASGDRNTMIEILKQIDKIKSQTAKDNLVKYFLTKYNQ